MRGHRGGYPLLTDEDLISLVGAGNAFAFNVLYDRHSRAVYSVARRLAGGDEREAEDLGQEAFLKVWRSAGSYRAERGGVRKWIFSVLRNQGVDRLRSRASHRRALEKAAAETVRSEPSEAFALAWRNCRWDKAREALETIPRAQLEVLALVHLSGLTHAEIAERLQVPLGTVKGRLRLGLKKLRDDPGVREMAVE